MVGSLSVLQPQITPDILEVLSPLQVEITHSGAEVVEDSSVRLSASIVDLYGLDEQETFEWTCAAEQGDCFAAGQSQPNLSTASVVVEAGAMTPGNYTWQVMCPVCAKPFLLQGNGPSCAQQALFPVITMVVESWT